MKQVASIEQLPLPEGGAWQVVFFNTACFSCEELELLADRIQESRNKGMLKLFAFVAGDEDTFHQILPYAEGVAAPCFFASQGSLLDQVALALARHFFLQVPTFACFQMSEIPIWVEDVHRKMVDQSLVLTTWLGDHRDFHYTVAKNTLSAFADLKNLKNGLSLKGGLKNSSMVICGAGGSLDIYAPWLSGDFRPPVMACGSSVGRLIALGVTPEIMVHVDPSPVAAMAVPPEAKNSLLFFQSRFSKDLRQACTGSLVWMPAEGSDIASIESWVLEKLSAAVASFDAGFSAANFGVALALWLGCSSIICLGVDFAYSEPHTHWGEGIMVERADGRKLVTRKDWLLSAQWLSRCVAAHQEVRWLRGESVQGLDVEGMEMIDLEGLGNDFSDHDPKTGLDLIVKLSEPLSDFLGDVDIDLEKHKAEELAACRASCLIQLGLWNKHQPLDPRDLPEYIAAVAQMEAISIFQMLVEPSWRAWEPVIVQACFDSKAAALHRLLFIKRIVERHQSL